MRSDRKELWFNLPRRMVFGEITGQVEASLAESGVREGLRLVKTW